MEHEQAFSLVKRIRAEDIRIVRMAYNSGSSVAFRDGALLCWIDTGKCLEEWKQVFILFHEAFHDDLSIPSTISLRDLEYEDMIDQRAIEAMSKYPEFVAYVTEQLRQAKINDLRDSIIRHIDQLAVERFRSWLAEVERVGIGIYIRNLDKLKAMYAWRDKKI